MDLTLNRDKFTDRSTQGVMNVPMPIISVQYQTLELAKKDGLPGSCIPAGRYRVTVAYSPHFKRRMPLLVGIPGRSEIEMHWGNYTGDLPSTVAVEHSDTRGCILVGRVRGVDVIYASRSAFDELFPLIDEADKTEGCWITIVDNDEG